MTFLAAIEDTSAAPSVSLIFRPFNEAAFERSFIAPFRNIPLFRLESSSAILRISAGQQTALVSGSAPSWMIDSRFYQNALCGKLEHRHVRSAAPPPVQEDCKYVGVYPLSTSTPTSTTPEGRGSESVLCSAPKRKSSSDDRNDAFDNRRGILVTAFQR